MASEAELVLDAKAAHGEGPAWDAREQVVYWVDIVGCALHVFDPASGTDRAIPVGQNVCAVAPRKAGGVVAALRDGFVFIDTVSGAVTPIVDPEADNPNNRFNDGKCGPGGRFWAGTCSNTCDVQGAGSLYCLDHDLQVRKVLDGLTVANGLTWSPDTKTMYYIDTPTFEVWAFDYDADAGDIHNRRVAVAVPEDEGYPDGMTCDAEGMLWVAHWDGSRVSRWNPETGGKLGDIRFPVERVSCCTFGGAELDTLYVTTSRLGLDEAALSRQPLAGGLFRGDPGVKGTPTFVFGG